MPIERTTLPKDYAVTEPTLIVDSVIGNATVIGPFNYICHAKIGERVRIATHCYICDNAVIGDDVTIYSGVKFSNAKHPWDENEHNPPHIEKGAVIGMNAFIGPGVTIGENSVVGAGATILKSIPPNSIVYCKIETVVKKRK